jgi:hypothetical protein
MKKRPPQAVDGKQGEQSPRLRLNKRLKAIIATGVLPSLSPSALTVLLFAVAHGDFTTCKVFLGAKTVANRLQWHRAGARRGIAELLAVGLLVEVKKCTNRQATVYKIALVPELIEGARERAAAVGSRRRKSDKQKAAESEAKKLKAKEVAERQGAHGCAPGGLMDESPEGSWVSPEGAHGCAPNLSSTVPSSLKERVGKRPRADAEDVAHDTKQTARLGRLRITQRHVAGAK